MTSEEEINTKINTENKEKQYWIDIRGKVHKYQGKLNNSIISMHTEIAFEVIPKMFKEVSPTTDFLFNLGWVMVGSSVYHSPITHLLPTQSQINTLYKLELYKYLRILHNGYYIYFKDYEKL